MLLIGRLIHSLPDLRSFQGAKMFCTLCMILCKLRCCAINQWFCYGGQASYHGWPLLKLCQGKKSCISSYMMVIIANHKFIKINCKISLDCDQGGGSRKYGLQGRANPIQFDITCKLLKVIQIRIFQYIEYSQK